MLGPAVAGHDAALEGAEAVGVRLLRAAASEPGRAEEAGSVVHVLHALTAVLAAGTPRALLVDDAHWADAASARFLLYLARRVEVLAVALIVGKQAHRVLEGGRAGP